MCRSRVKIKSSKEIRSEIRKSDFVYLATDPDREGEAISYNIKELFKLKDKNSRRVTFNEITKQAVRSGIENPRDIDIDLVNAQQARRILDRIVGYQLSPFLWRKGQSAVCPQAVCRALQPVWSWTVRTEIRAFVPEEYWSIEALLQTADGSKFSARYYGDANGKAELKNEEQAMHVVNAVTGKLFTVGNIKRGKKKRTAAPPFITSTLQQEASRKLNMTPRRTMSIAQELYEGIELGEYGLTGLITYMRTDFRSVWRTRPPLPLRASFAAATARNIIRASRVCSRPRATRRTRTKPFVRPTCSCCLKKSAST